MPIIDGPSLITPIGPTRDDLTSPGSVGSATTGEGTSFANVLASAIDQANTLDRTAATRSEGFANGSIDDIHGTLIASREADIAVHLVGSVRNKLMDAFHELWHTSI